MVIWNYLFFSFHCSVLKHFWYFSKLGELPLIARVVESHFHKSGEFHCTAKVKRAKYGGEFILSWLLFIYLTKNVHKAIKFF